MIFRGLLLLVVPAVFFVGAKFGEFGADRRGAFTKGYLHGWHDGCNGIRKMDYDYKAQLYLEGKLPMLGTTEHEEMQAERMLHGMERIG